MSKQIFWALPINSGCPRVGILLFILADQNNSVLIILQVLRDVISVHTSKLEHFQNQTSSQQSSEIKDTRKCDNSSDSCVEPTRPQSRDKLKKKKSKKVKKHKIKSNKSSKKNKQKHQLKKHKTKK